MEMMKPEAKKKKPSKLPPWPPEPQRIDTEQLDKPTPVVPPRPKQNELSHTQYRLKRLEMDGEASRNMPQSETKEKKSETPVPAPRRAEKERNWTPKHSQRNSDHKQISAIQSDAATDTKQSHVTDNQDRGDDAPDKKTTSTKPGVLKGVMKHLKSTSKAGGGSGGEAPLDPDKEAAAQEKERTDGDKVKQEVKSAESKQDFGGRFAGMFRKAASVTVGLVDSDSEETDDQKPPEQEHAGFFNGMFKKKPAETTQPDEEQQPGIRGDLSDSSASLSEKAASEEKGGFFSGILRKSPKLPKETIPKQDPEELSADLSGSTDSLTDNKEKGGFFSGFLKKTPKADTEELTSTQKELSSSNDSLSDVTKPKEKGSAFGGMFKKSPRTSEMPNAEEPQDDERSLGSDGPSEEKNKEKGGLFGGFFKKTAKASQPDQDESVEKKLSASSEDLSGKAEKDRGLFGVFLKKFPKGERADSPDREEDKEQATTKAVGGDDVADRGIPKDKNLFSNMFKKPQKPTEGDKEALVKSEVKPSGSLENLSENVPKVKKGGLAGIFRRSNSQDNLLDEEKGGLFGGLKRNTNKAPDEDQAAGDKEKSSSNDNLSENTNAKGKSIFSGMFKKAPKAGDEESNGDEEKKLLSASNENLTEENAPKEKVGGLAGLLKKSPKPAPRSLATKDPLSDGKQEESVKDDLSGDELAGPPVDLEAATAKEKKGGFTAMFKRTPKTADKQDNDNDEEVAPSAGGGLKRRMTIKKKRRVISFRVKTTLPKMPKLNGSSQAQEKMPVIEESLEMQEMIPAQSTVEVQPVEMAAYPTEGNPLESEEENDGLMEWWKNVIGWAEWNETANFQEDEEGIAMEEAADRVYMAARLFVRLFNQRGASLQHCILELLAVADTADQFHKKTISAAVGGRVASVAGSLTTITGLILAPFTFGASIIVTAVGIGVATAGSITSATANITDAVHSNMDRKKVEKMIQDYQEQIKDIRECMNFVQEGIDTLQEWDFEKYTQSAAKKAMNRNIKHVVKEGGRAGKALMINTDKLISTVQVLSAGAGAAKAAQAISVTTGVMSALFLALDVFFLAKDSHDLRKGAKTKFASKIRDVCKELQDGLLELNKVKTQLQKTMDGIEVEEYEEIEEVEVEVEVDDDLESDPKKLAELEQELDLMELKLDKRIEWGKIAEKKEGLRKKDKMDKEIENRITGSKEKQEKETAASHKKVEEKPKKKDNGGQDERRDSQQSRESSRRDHTEWRIASSHRSHHRRAEERAGDEVCGEEKE
ncbi:titin homolog isoform X4 [Hippocampus comes]|uniref:titin homolog isoform X4 n=1 Tax=Hippocampus comes TaxID=109280 RepID=UPI00094E5DB7|nr:PREDICTED: titin homolog isoform X4 [Hippocampus comes]